MWQAREKSIWREKKKKPRSARETRDGENITLACLSLARPIFFMRLLRRLNRGRSLSCTTGSNGSVCLRTEQRVTLGMGPLQLAVTWYKIRHAGEQAVHWDIQTKATSSRQICIFFVLDVPVRSLLSSMADFVPCDC